FVRAATQSGERFLHRDIGPRSGMTRAEVGEAYDYLASRGQIIAIASRLGTQLSLAPETKRACKESGRAKRVPVERSETNTESTGGPLHTSPTRSQSRVLASLELGD